MKEVDITIVGGGVVGNLLALQLAQSTSLSVALIEAQAYSTRQHPGFDSRVIALSAQSVEVLNRCHVPLHQLLRAPIDTIQVSDQGGLGWVELSAADHGLPAFGQVVSLQQLGEALHAQVRKTHVQCIIPAKPVDIVRQQNDVHIQLDDSTAITTRLLVLADGGRSPLASSLGFKVQHTPYPQMAITLNLTTQRAHQGKAYERFTPYGPLAFLPFAHTAEQRGAAANSYSVVWCVSEVDCERLLSFPDSVFRKALQQAFGWRQGEITHVGERQCYPLGLTQLDRCFQHRVVAVGNAAQTLHPIAGQGFNLGLRDVTVLADHLATCQDPGAFAVLDSYAQQRESDKRTSIFLTDGLLRLFSNKMAPLTLSRNIGLSLMALCPSLQKTFVLHTTGRSQQYEESHYDG